MGTNYYVDNGTCECCKRDFESIHIGKSSYGWYFSLHVIPELGLNSLGDWKEYLKDKKIKDEYRDDITLDDLLDIIENRSHPVPTNSRVCSRDAEPGKNNLLKHKVDGRHCIGTGEGTYSYITGEFS